MAIIEKFTRMRQACMLLSCAVIVKLVSFLLLCTGKVSVSGVWYGSLSVFISYIYSSYASQERVNLYFKYHIA